MTKKVRIENADCGDYKVRVRYFEKGINGAPDVLTNTDKLPFPANLHEGFITSTRYAIVDEYSGDE